MKILKKINYFTKLNNTLILICFLFVFLFFAKRMIISPVDPWDEVTYLWNGIDANFTPTWAPLYSCWYRLLFYLFNRNPVFIFRMGHFLVLFITSILIFDLTKLLSNSKLKALSCMLIVISWNPWGMELTQVNHFNLMLYLVLMCIAFRVSDSFDFQMFFIGLFSLFFCYVRQENLIISIGCLFVCFVRFFLNEYNYKKIFLGIFLISVILILFIFYSPFQSRGWLAFSDHFYFANNDGNTKEFIIYKNFGNSQSILSAFWTAPKAFLTYVMGNWIFLRKWPKDILIFNYLLFIPTFFIIISSFDFTIKDRFFHTFKNTRFKVFYFVSFLFIIRAIISVSLFEPFFRYFFEAVILLYICLSINFQEKNMSESKLRIIYLLMSISILISSCLPKVGWDNADNAFQLRLKLTELIEKLSNIPDINNKTFFAAPAYSFYLGNIKYEESNFNMVVNRNPLENTTQLIKKLLDKKIDIFVFDQATDLPLRQSLSLGGYFQLKNILIKNCYLLWHHSSFDKVYIRKKKCN